MAAQAKVHGFPGAVFHSVDDVQRAALQLIADGERKGEGIDLPRLPAVGHAQDHAAVLLHNRDELAAVGKAVAGHLIPLAVEGVAVLRQAAHIGEQVGGAVAPVGGVAAPEVLRAVGGSNGHYLGAQTVNGYPHDIVPNGIKHGITPCIMCHAGSGIGACFAISIA